jgi:Xaa-Pro aminopeptidase
MEYRLFDTAIYTQRRQRLAKAIGDGLILLPGNVESAFNYRGNPYPFRQDSSFLYYAGLDLPGLTLVIDAASGEAILYGHEPTMEDTVWTGPQPSLASLAEAVGIDKVAPPDRLVDLLKRGKVHYLPSTRGDNTLLLATWLDRTPREVVGGVSEALIQAVVAQRAIKGPEEIEEMVWAVSLSGRMHVAVMREAEEGMLESELSSIVRGMCEAEQVMPAYGIILSTDGQTLHNHYHGKELQSGQLVLGDFGAESLMHYAGDITRTFPVDRFFTEQQRDIYAIVLEAEEKAIQACKPGVRYRDIHLMAARIIASGLKEVGLMQGDVDEAVAAGAHALFFPHGLGHMIGLDVHDMEGLGEDYVGYAGELARSDQFGLAYLRMARTLQPGYVLTVEPGIYFIPELIDQWQKEGLHKPFINYKALEGYRDFGGIRIEDNVLIDEEHGRVILGEPIPKSIAEIEALRYEV